MRQAYRQSYQERVAVSGAYVHGYHRRENDRLQDQAGTLVDVLHSDTSYPPGSVVLEATRPASQTGVHTEYRVLI